MPGGGAEGRAWVLALVAALDGGGDGRGAGGPPRRRRWGRPGRMRAATAARRPEAAAQPDRCGHRRYGGHAPGGRGLTGRTDEGASRLFSQRIGACPAGGPGGGICANLPDATGPARAAFPTPFFRFPGARRMTSLDSYAITRKWPASHPDRIQLYSLPTPNGVKVSILLEELGCPTRRTGSASIRRTSSRPSSCRSAPTTRFPPSSIPTGPMASRWRCSSPAPSWFTWPARPASSCRPTRAGVSRRCNG